MRMTQSAVCRLLMGALFLHFAVHTPAQPLPITAPQDVGFSSERLGRLHAFVQKQVDAGKYSGSVTLIARNGKIADWQTFGYRDLESRAPMEKDTIFRIYSMSKIITSVAVMMLFEEGCFGLDDPIGNYIPELKNMKVFKGGTVENPEVVDAVGAITIKVKLAKSGGLP
jgi:CubicO group peptidase (beta-lactamase class C family)